MQKIKTILIPAGVVLVSIIAVWLIIHFRDTASYVYNEGFAHGTTYHITYNHPRGKNLNSGIKKVIRDIDQSLSIYDSTSVISRINRNDPNVEADKDFINVFNKSTEISRKTNGAFDITVAPLVNAWGFGFEDRQKIDSAKVDSLLQFVGYTKVTRENKRIVKDTPGVMMDVNAVAKGYSVDRVARYLEDQNIPDYLVEIGGEVRVKGENPDGKHWQIGIDKPVDDPQAKNRKLKDIIQITDKSLATSGNYRRFYIKDGVKYSHTINPKTGYPVKHSLLSASVIAKDCMTADAYATAFMVMGLEKSKKFVNDHPALEAYFIYSDEQGNEQILFTEAFGKKIKNVDK